jgi:tRNA (pseudouridine54-N1)-methyltransferase
MRTFVLFSENGRTKGDFKDLMKAGRLDIICHSVISSFFLSNAIRNHVELHIILNGPPDPPKHIEFRYDPENSISKKDIGSLLKSALWKYRKGKKIEASPGVSIEKKSFDEIMEDLKDRPIYLLDANGMIIDDVNIKKDPVFVLGDHMGLPRHEKSVVKKLATERISIGPAPYFSSQCIVVLNNVMDRRDIF